MASIAALRNASESAFRKPSHAKKKAARANSAVQAVRNLVAEEVGDDDDNDEELIVLDICSIFSSCSVMTPRSVATFCNNSSF